MTHEKRLQLILDVCGDMYRLADTKGKEYSNGGDALGNFKRVAAELDITPEMACWVYTKKHLDAIASYIRTGTEHSTESIDGRIYDAALYLILLLGIIQEKRYEKKSPFDEIIYLPESTESEIIKNLENKFENDLPPIFDTDVFPQTYYTCDCDCEDEDEEVDDACHCDVVDVMAYLCGGEKEVFPYIFKDEPFLKVVVRGE